MKRLWIPVIFACLTAGCSVNAEDSASTYSATVIESGESEAVLQLEEIYEEEEEDSGESEAVHTEYPDDRRIDTRTGMFTVASRDDVLVFEDGCIGCLSDLERNEKVIVTLMKGKAVIHVMENENGSDF